MGNAINALEQRDFFGNGDTVPCARCGYPCRLPPASSPNARILRGATSVLGVCPSCHVTAFLQDPELPFRESIEKHGVAETLRLPHVQRGVNEIARAGQADIPGEAVDWERVIANWDLPHPQAPKRGKKR
jgi:hypothetical protein